MAIIGPSGGGKGTQAGLLEKKYGWKHISVGQLFRDEIKRGTEIGRKVKPLIEKGVWVPTDLTIKVLDQTLKGVIDQGFILDGFPRAPDQPLALDRYLEKNGARLDLVIHLDIRPEVIMARRKKHWQKGKSFYQDKRKDETEEAIRNRIISYQKTIEPILAHYQKKGILERVDGERPIESIFEDIVRLVERRLAEKR